MLPTPLQIATVFGLGHLPGAPGTWASVAAIPLAWLLHAIGGFWLVAAATVLIACLGWWATGHVLAERAGPGDAVELQWNERSDAYVAPGHDDPSEIVIDEVVGMLIALWPLSAGLTIMGSAWHVWPWPGWVLGFLLFRFFDIVKPPPVRWADDLPGAFGVMLDDIVAGGLTAVLALIAAGISHGWF